MSVTEPKPATDGDSVMLELRTATREHHDRAEHHPFQRALAKGQLAREAYVEHLGQMYHVHAALDAALRTARDADARVRAIVGDEQFQAENVRRDLEHFGAATTDHPALPGAATLIERITHADPVTLLGYHYVLEGSKNGGRFIARGLARAYGLDSDGLRMFDPHGEEQPALWAQFKVAMDAQSFTREERDTLVQSAGAMFDAIADISTNLSERVTIPA